MARVRDAQSILKCRIRAHAYSEVFGRRQAPVGTLIFTDFDHLHTYEVDAAALAQRAVLAVAPGTRVLNRPERVMQRTAMLRHLHMQGLNPVIATRIDTGEVPSRFPVFLREEAGYAGPETELLQDEADYTKALETLVKSGRSLTGRVSLSFEAERDKDGFYRKYGAFIIGDHVIPQHILRSVDWNVKSGNKETDAAFIAEELQYVQNNPHSDALRTMSHLCGIEFGRIDYGIKDGQIVIFEINTNPTFPRFIGGNPDREARRRVIADRIGAAFAEIDDPRPLTWVAFDDSASENSAFVERDPWFRHPFVALRRKHIWLALNRVLRVQTLLSPERWRRAIRRRVNNLRFLAFGQKRD